MNELDTVAIKEEAASAAEQDGDLRSKVREITVRALSQRSLSVSEISAVVGSVTEGVSLGLSRRAGEIKHAVSDALSGLDEALKKAAESTKLAAQQMASQGKEFGAQDLKPALDDFKKMEEMFLSTVSSVSAAAGGRIKEEFTSQLTHLRRNGTDSGRVVAATVAEFSHSAGASVKNGVQQTASAAKEVKQRLMLLASGLLAGMADALHEKAKPGERKAP